LSLLVDLLPEGVRVILTLGMQWIFHWTSLDPMQEKECDDAMEETHDGPGSPIRGAHHELHGDEDDNQQKQIENEKLALLEPCCVGICIYLGD